MPSGTSSTTTHTTWCEDHDDDALDCSSKPASTHGISTWLTRSGREDQAQVTSEHALTRPQLGDLIERLRELHARMR